MHAVNIEITHIYYHQLCKKQCYIKMPLFTIF